MHQMSILKILKFPNKILQNKAENLKGIDKNINVIINDMIETMFYYDALGIAATQIAFKKKIIIINMSNNYIKQPLILINPEIIIEKGFSLNEEGCLSFPNIFVNIERSEYIYIKFYDLFKKTHFLKISKMLSICLQHEVDHLNGVTIYDRANSIVKRIILKKFL